MPNLIHDLAQSMSSPNCRLVKDNGSCSFSQQSRHVSLLSKDVEQRILEIVKNAPKLRSLLLPSGHLKNLGEALDKLSTLPPSMGNLAGLHNLPVFQVGHENGYGIEELEKMAHLSGTLHISKLEKARNAGATKLNEKKSLDKLVFEWSDRVVNTQDEATTENSVLEDLQPHSNLKELQILRYRGNEFPAWMKEGRLQNLVSLTLNGCIKCKTLALGQLPKLRALYVKGMQELERLIEVECGSLRWLKLSNCPELRELPSIFPNLQVLKIKSCNSLRALPVTPTLRFLTLVDNLILEDWNELILELEVGHDEGQRDTNVQPSLIELLELKVISCPKLQALPKIFAPQKLEISHCELLTTLPPPQNARRLRHLALDGCDDGALVRAIPDTNYLGSLVISSISNISPLPQWPRLPGLKALYIRDCKDLVSLSNGEEGSLRTLTSLKLLSIRNCEKLETLNEELPISLECLIIESCPLLNSFSLNNLPSLTDLYGCQNEGGKGPDLPKIEHIPDLEIDNSHIVFPSTSVAKPPVWCFLLLLCCGGSLTSREEGMVKNAATDHNKAQPGEIFLEHKKKKKWADEKTGHSCFMLYARALDFSLGNRAYWIWNCFKETSDENIEVAKLLHVCYLDVRGKLNVSELSPEVVYEIVYVVKLTKGAYGWEFPILLRLSLPDGRVQERHVSLLEKPRRQWIELNVGNFLTKNGESGEVGFDIYQRGGHWKKGLIIKGAIFRPKQTTP
ncbi:hypothetical protein FH972_014939 [Carpinus fangiana]|uniref:R13L1/DRL21-like LRR repeat region domain-containing protein n=1 Tax=Carpinus fangiana TaxID=176857 RepID=A0A5N6REG1_9ROSI|nr:hypothetical protein FH972_014939 [Carpinus fangiana]